MKALVLNALGRGFDLDEVDIASPRPGAPLLRSAGPRKRSAPTPGAGPSWSPEEILR